MVNSVFGFFYTDDVFEFCLEAMYQILGIYCIYAEFNKFRTDHFQKTKV